LFLKYICLTYVIKADGLALGKGATVVMDRQEAAVPPFLKSDLVGIMEAIIDQRLDEVKVEWYGKEAACVVLASGGYPAYYTIYNGLSYNRIE
jgi:phosphoribosylamine-glycine ligase